MNTVAVSENLSKEDKYRTLIPQLKALTVGEHDTVANMANVCAALKETFGWWWVGFYVVRNNQLVLGPFQGPVACTRIDFGKGVCGKAWQLQQTIIVPDVTLFDGHIACSPYSKSEIVVPVFAGNQVAAVLDVDSEYLNFFDETDKAYLEQIAALIKFNG